MTLPICDSASSSPYEGPNLIDRLPKDLLLHIFSLVKDTPPWNSLALVNKTFNRLCKDDALWKPLFHAVFPEYGKVGENARERFIDTYTRVYRQSKMMEGQQLDLTNYSAAVSKVSAFADELQLPFTLCSSSESLVQILRRNIYCVPCAQFNWAEDLPLVLMTEEKLKAHCNLSGVDFSQVVFNCYQHYTMVNVNEADAKTEYETQVRLLDRGSLSLSSLDPVEWFSGAFTNFNLNGTYVPRPKRQVDKPTSPSSSFNRSGSFAVSKTII